jgi:hypothetical protein
VGAWSPAWPRGGAEVTGALPSQGAMWFLGPQLVLMRGRSHTEGHL